ncbi:hypothetical protein ASG37_02005 [Sphingomonas sp. Leaf407]|nr:hypothetical protein ASE97_02030 [Sphingomonas sp. Leaf42]KQT29941.1 hypothetical protein ASG37_02005 [Sphingomonas sp. Leaf407]
MTMAATMVLACATAGCGVAPVAGGPELTVAGPSAAVEAFVRAQGAHRPTRMTSFPQALGDGRSSARVMMPIGTPAAAMQALSQEAVAAGLRSIVVAPG